MGEGRPRGWAAVPGIAAQVPPPEGQAAPGEVALPPRRGVPSGEVMVWLDNLEERDKTSERAQRGTPMTK